ncbi:phage gp6-like head-tail connector protein [Streptomyces sp. DSM 44917]|uniref:Phage gp6-like head-tail connector protein n=1 Tax=Streptomyces boetiae TaxID=3075541 RepID=A0ABU2L6B4_9ACTN|nr:phage gp6-like head-tail connector protein [Streptomyces sp. DSM 44917]MDT0306868.1 phage gp6-like head-tail connector protein [Streptomyces sp. DSM 44917]
MANEYADLAALKGTLNIETADTTADAALNRALTAASRSIDRTCGRRFWLDPAPVARTYRLRGRLLCEDDGELLLTDDIGSATGLVVETGSGSTWTTAAGWETAPENAAVEGRPVTGLLRTGGTWGWDHTSARVRVTARWGWPQVPDEVVQATLIQAARLYRRKDSPEGVTGSAEWGVVRLSRRDPDVWALIEGLILHGFG